MNDVERWIYFDGPEPERVRPLLDALRDLPPATPQDRERAARRFFEALDSTLKRSEAPPGEEEGRESNAPGAPPARPDAERRVVDRSDAIEPSHALPPHPLDTPARPPAAITRTATLELPDALRGAVGVLPFKPVPRGQPRTAKTLQVPMMRVGLGETAPLGDDSIAKAVAALPFAGNTVGVAIVPFPRLELEQYASLRAELAVRPERSAETLLRYHVLSEAARRALDEHWHTHFADDPEACAAFESTLAQYIAWLRTLPR